MAEDEGAGFRFHPGYLALGLLGLAALFGLIALGVGWFSLNTQINGWAYDPSAPDSKGEACGVTCRVTVYNEMKPLSLGTDINPDFLQQNLPQEPSYEDNFPRTGTHMMGVFLMQVVVVVAIAATVAFYVWNKTARRDLRRTVSRLTITYALMSTVVLAYMAFTVPAAAEADARETLVEYHEHFQRQAPEVPDFPPDMLKVNVSLYLTWTCCPCCPEESVFRGPQGDNYLYEVQAKSRPSAGFWLEAVGVVLSAAAIPLGIRSGDLQPKQAQPGQPPPPIP